VRLLAQVTENVTPGYRTIRFVVLVCPLLLGGIYLPEIVDARIDRGRQRGARQVRKHQRRGEQNSEHKDNPSDCFIARGVH
jgi:hypothetical protein